MVHEIIHILTRYTVVFHPQQIPYFEPVKRPLFHCSHDGLPPLGMLRLDLTDPHLIDPPSWISELCRLRVFLRFLDECLGRVERPNIPMKGISWANFKGTKPIRVHKAWELFRDGIVICHHHHHNKRWNFCAFEISMLTCPGPPVGSVAVFPGLQKYSPRKPSRCNFLWGNSFLTWHLKKKTFNKQPAGAFLDENTRSELVHDSTKQH